MRTRAPISVIIPTYNAAANMGEPLTRIMEGVNAGIVRELVISDAGSNDGIKELADELGAEFLLGDKGRGGQILRGIAHAQGDWFLILHADTWLPEGWSQEALKQFEMPQNAMVFSLKFRATGLMPMLTAGWANLRTRLFDLPYGDQAMLIHRDLLEQTGGYPHLPLMEDVALARTLKGHITLSPLCVQTDPSRYQQNGWLSQGAGNLLRLLRFLRGADPEQLRRGYR
jgi:rSAM/selenodomain-associated transferase 2